MGLMDVLMSLPTNTYGYKTFRNDYGWDNEKMLEMLSKNNLVYGVPKMGWIRAFGKERQVVVYNHAHKTNYVYVDAQKRKIIVSMAPKPGQIGGAIDHVDPEDVHKVNNNTVSATLGTMEMVDRVSEIVESLIKLRRDNVIR